MNHSPPLSKSISRLALGLIAWPIAGLISFGASAQALRTPNTAVTLAERGAQRATAMDHRAFHFMVPDTEYERRLLDEGRFKVELDEILVPRSFAKQAWPHTNETDLERSYRTIQTEKAQLEIALAIADKRARDALAKQPDAIDRRAREIYATTDAPASRRAMSVDFQQILFDVSARPLEENVARVKDARAMLAAGESFDIVAKKFSDDAAVLENAGRIMAASAAAVDPQLSRILIDELKPGEVSPKLVSTRRGLHILKLLQVNQPQKRPYEEVRNALYAGVLDEAGKNARNELLKKIADGEIKFNQGAIEQVVAKPDPKALELARELSRKGLEASRQQNATQPQK
jgi:hypothetical protein